MQRQFSAQHRIVENRSPCNRSPGTFSAQHWARTTCCAFLNWFQKLATQHATLLRRKSSLQVDSCNTALKQRAVNFKIYVRRNKAVKPVSNQTGTSSFFLDGAGFKRSSGCLQRNHFPLDLCGDVRDLCSQGKNENLFLCNVLME